MARDAGKPSARYSAPVALIGPLATGIAVPLEKFLREPGLDVAPELASLAGFAPLWEYAPRQTEEQRWESLENFRRFQWLPRFISQVSYNGSLPQVVDPRGPGHHAITFTQLFCGMTYGAAAFILSGEATSDRPFDAQALREFIDRVSEPSLSCIRGPVRHFVELSRAAAVGRFHLRLDDELGDASAVEVGSPLWAHRLIWYRPENLSEEGGRLAPDRGLFEGSLDTTKIDVTPSVRIFIHPAFSYLLSSVDAAKASECWTALRNVLALQEAHYLSFLEMDRSLALHLSELSTLDAERKVPARRLRLNAKRLLSTYEASERLNAVLQDQRRFLNSQEGAIWDQLDLTFGAAREREGVLSRAHDVHALYERTVDVLRERHDQRVQRLFQFLTLFGLASLLIAMADFSQNSAMRLPGNQSRLAGLAAIVISVLAIAVAAYLLYIRED